MFDRRESLEPRVSDVDVGVFGWLGDDCIGCCNGQKKYGCPIGTLDKKTFRMKNATMKMKAKVSINGVG